MIAQQAGYGTQTTIPVSAQHLQQQQQQQQQQHLTHEQLAMSSHNPYSVNQSGFTTVPPALSNPFSRQQPANQLALIQPNPQNFLQQQAQLLQQQQQPYNSNFPQSSTGQFTQNQFPGQQPGFPGQQQSSFQGQQQPGFQGQQQPGFQGQQQPGFQGHIR